MGLLFGFWYAGFPAIPMQNAKDFHQLISKDIKHLELTYKDFYAKLLTQMISNLRVSKSSMLLKTLE